MASSCAQVPKRLNHPCTSLVLHISLHAYWPLVGSTGMAQLGKLFLRTCFNSPSGGERRFQKGCRSVAERKGSLAALLIAALKLLFWI